MNGSFFSVAISLMLAVGSVPCVADDGQALYKSHRCATCHGADGKKTLMPIYPKLAGQNKAYLLQEMKEINEGHRNEGMTTAMKPSLEKLSRTEMESIAEWLSSLE